MKATVVKNENGRVTVRLQGGSEGGMVPLTPDLKAGDMVEVKHVPNNPYSPAMMVGRYIAITCIAGGGGKEVTG